MTSSILTNSKLCEVSIDQGRIKHFRVSLDEVSLIPTSYRICDSVFLFFLVVFMNVESGNFTTKNFNWYTNHEIRKRTTVCTLNGFSCSLLFLYYIRFRLICPDLLPKYPLMIIDCI